MSPLPTTLRKLRQLPPGTIWVVLLALAGWFPASVDAQSARRSHPARESYRYDETAPRRGREDDPLDRDAPPLRSRPGSSDSTQLRVIRADAWGRDELPQTPTLRAQYAPRSTAEEPDAFGLTDGTEIPPRSPRFRPTRREPLDAVEPNVPGPTRWNPPRQQPLESDNPTPADRPAWMGELPPAQELISRRYRDPAIQQLLASASADQILSMYTETLQLINERHLSPHSPAQLSKRGLYNLVEALGNRDFLASARLRVSGELIQQFEQELVAQFRGARIDTPSQAAALLQNVMQLAQQRLQMNPALVGLEFEYGAIEALDQFSAFVPPPTTRVRSGALPDESVVGIGVQVEVAPQGLRVLRVLEGGPAAQAGVRAEDRIVAVDGRPLAGLDLNGATGLITGPEGTPVSIALSRPNGQTASLVVPRRRVDVQTVVDVQMLTADTGYLKLDSFGSGSVAELERALEGLAGRGMRSLILDLRGNPGGLLTTAIDSARLFVKNGTVVSTRGRNTEDNSTEPGATGATWTLPLALLVDGDSASASEILAAAIQENRRGLIVGEPTYGKGSVQTLFPLQTLGSSVRLTTALFFSPNGREMAGEGVSPDVPVSAMMKRSGTGSDPVIAAAVAAVQQPGGFSRGLQFGAKPNRPLRQTGLDGQR